MAKRQRKNSASMKPLGGIPLLVHVIPTQIYRSPAHLRKAIDAILCEICKSLLAAPEQIQLSKWMAGGLELPDAVCRQVDAVILKQAETFGWRLVLSRVVQRRFSAWAHQANGPELFRHFGAALARSARILQGRELPPIDDPGLHDYKHWAVRELEIALRRLRSTLGRVGRAEQVIEAFRRVVSEKDDLPLLQENLESWVQFFQKIGGARLRDLALRKRIPAASIFDEQRAHYTRYNQETLRQKTSTLRRRNPTADKQ